jgi:hypothetical protein
MTNFAFQQVDVFTSRSLRGNPLAVVVGADALTDGQMAAFANWTTCDFIPRNVWANAHARDSDDLDHERGITLAIRAAIHDLIEDTNRHVIQAGSGRRLALARRFEWNPRAKPA